jgi:hypothetical protein
MLGGRIVIRFWSDPAIGSVELAPSRRSAGRLAVRRNAALVAVACIGAAWSVAVRIVAMRRGFLNADTCD